MLATDPHPRLAVYLLPLATIDPGKAPGAPDAGALSYDLSGVEATWSQEGDPGPEPQWSGWWPRLDFDAARG